MSLIAVIYTIWAGAQMLLFPTDEESANKTKKIITSVFIGIVIIWFAYWIVSTIFFVVNNNKVASIFVPKASAESQIRAIDFTTYSNKILALKSRIVAWYSPEVTRELSILIDGAYDHLPDRADIYINRQLYDSVKKAIADYDLHREEIDRGLLENAINTFLEQTQTFSIQGQIWANPSSGDAPLSVTLEARNVIDGSGTVIPETNYTWWLRKPDGPHVLWRGKTINYEFREEGTFTVYLTVNSASKNSRWFTDVISYEDDLIVEIWQPKLKYVIYFNEQLANDSIKIPTKESMQKVLIDATQTKFAYGYTITKTEWDFGNGKWITREGPPIIEAQNYNEGEYTIKMTLTRNDGEVFSKNIILKIGDPIASIAVNNKRPNKWQIVIFEAKKATQEGVLYIWEIRKFGSEQILYSTTSPRMEYTFKDTGRYSVSLISSKDQIRDKETIDINVESRPPIVRFLSDVRSTETPNTFIFDGTSTYDPDYPDNQALKYNWFINDRPVTLDESNSSNSFGMYTFNEIGTHQVELQVTDEEGKISSFKKNISVKSLLSIQLNIRPQVVKRGERVQLHALAPNTDIYQWTVGSKETTTTETGRHTVIFDKSGIYPLSLKVTDRYSNTNTLQRKLYVVDGDMPFSVINIFTKSLLSETQKWVCDGNDAIIVDRVAPVSFTWDKSVNVWWNPTNLSYFWKIGLNTSSSQKNFSHTFDELWCEKISLTVNDKKTGASHTSEEWIKVVNIPPRFSDIQVNVENIDQDPMRIHLKMEWAKDPDGNITSYTWYYYTSSDQQPQGFRITTKPETSFTLPKINGRYYFSVVLEDANGLKVDTRDISDSQFSTPDLLVNQNISMPIIEFSTSASEIKFWEPVNFSVNVRNALGQDIANVSEFRWDFDGDWFYDTKTTEPTFTYKYTIPAEYHPKVKVTHRGLSTTKFITLNVINRLNPQAILQIIGDKIIAYNTSTGIAQSVSWYADDKKISENKEYLVFDASSSQFPTQIKLQISNGKDTQEAIFPVSRNAKSKVLIKKIDRPMIILSNHNEWIENTPDDILWTDPLKPLFLYLGESTGDIQYYTIDNDIEVDTDLSGGKDDDADNKGTASYRMGRPYSVPIGKKRTTIMRFRLIKNDGTEIDSRQIRVTRDFIAPPVIESENTSPNIKNTTTTFNLSNEDKTRLERLQTLVKNVPSESQKELQRYIDQLWDIWYDRADKAETLLQFSHAVDGDASIPAELKTRILEQVNLIYTQWEQDAEEKTIAKKILNDFLAKSSYKKEIFGDGTDENVGLLGDMIDTPEYYEKNSAIVRKIYDEYIKFDTQLSEEAKAVIKDKLTILVGEAPSTPIPTEGTDGSVEKVSFFSHFNIANIGMIVAGIMAFLVGIFGLIFVVRKFRHKSITYATQDSNNHTDGLSTIPAAEHHGPDWLHAADESHNLSPNASNWFTDTSHSDTPDWLKESESSFGSDDVLSKQIQATQETTTPSWMHAEEIHTSEPPIPTQSDRVTDLSSQTNTTLSTSKSISAASESAVKADIPDWLWEGEDRTNTSPETATTEISATNSETTESEVAPSSLTWVTSWEHIMDGDSKNNAEYTTHEHEDIPDWLKGSEAPSLLSEETKDIRSPLFDTGTVTSAGTSESTQSVSSKTEEENIDTTTEWNNESRDSISWMSINIEDIPDWLKETTTPVAQNNNNSETSAPEALEPDQQSNSVWWDMPSGDNEQSIHTLEDVPKNTSNNISKNNTWNTVKKSNNPSQIQAKKQWNHKKHWHKKKMKKDAKNTPKFLTEWEHLIGPANDLLPPSTHLIDPDNT